MRELWSKIKWHLFSGHSVDNSAISCTRYSLLKYDVNDQKAGNVNHFNHHYTSSSAMAEKLRDACFVFE